VKVLAIGTETAATATGGNGQPSPTAAGSGLITFEVTPDQALQIVNANSEGALYLTLLPLSASEGSGGSVPANNGR
jgi:hypothetical protein